MRTHRQKEALKRNTIAIAGTLFFHLLLAILVILIENRRADLELYSGPVRITLGQPDAPENTQRQEDPQTEQEQLEPQEPAEEVTQPEEVIPQESVTEPEQETIPVAEPEQRETPQETSPEESAQESSSQAVTPAEEAQSEPQPVRGQAYGNTHELFLESAGGEAGRNLWTPIYLYMPLPSQLDQSLLDQSPGDPGLGITPQDDRSLILNFYKRSAGQLELKAPVELDFRPEVWIVLERMGYDLAQAEYKIARVLTPVEINFTIGVVQDDHGGFRTMLAQSEIVKSSGYDDIDQAILYGFSRSAYYNDSERELKGRFIYRFY